MNKVKCFACHKMGHYVSQCPNNKKKHVAASTEVDEFFTRFEKEFSLLVCLSTSATSTSVWYIDSGVSNHMTGMREHFTDLTESRVDLEVVLGDNSKVKAVGRGIVSLLEGVPIAHGSEGCVVCPWVDEELNISFYHRGQEI